MSNLSNGYKIHSSPPPGSGAIVESIVKIFDNFRFSLDQNMDEDVYIKLLESFKFSFAQRSNLGDPFNSSHACDIQMVS